MPYLIGTDEAGYGPNLGPLVVSASLWEVSDDVRAEDLYERLAPCIVPLTKDLDANARTAVAMADSKQLYQSKGSLRNLERGVLAALGLLKHRPSCWSELIELLDPRSTDVWRSIPWYADFEVSIPIDADADEIGPLVDSLSEGLDSAGVRLVHLESRVVFAELFNQLIEHYDNKGAVLSHTTLELAARLARPLEGETVCILCDKHGGRNRYTRLLEEHFPDRLIEIHGESKHESLYRFGPQDARLEVAFCMKAESRLTVALASMVSKYLRELAMRGFNQFWSRRVDNLKPTAGYPQDARRFRDDVDAIRNELGIQDPVFWRSR